MKESIIYKEISESELDDYAKIPSCYRTDKKFELKKIDNGLGGISISLVDCDEYLKDFGCDVSFLKKTFDLSNWKFFVACNEEGTMIGGCTVATKTSNCTMLEKRDDLALLWDLRVAEEYKHQGIGQKLFNMAKDYAIKEGFKQFKVECQNTNPAAVKFYHKQGMILGVINEHAYKDFPNEVQLLWYLDL